MNVQESWAFLANAAIKRPTYLITTENNYGLDKIDAAATEESCKCRRVMEPLRTLAGTFHIHIVLAGLSHLNISVGGSSSPFGSSSFPIFYRNTFSHTVTNASRTTQKQAH